MEINFSVNGEKQYSTEFVARIIEEYIYRLKGAKIIIDLSPIVSGDSKETNLFEKAANYAIPAYEGGFKRTANDNTD